MASSTYQYVSLRKQQYFKEQATAAHRVTMSLQAPRDVKKKIGLDNISTKYHRDNGPRKMHVAKTCNNFHMTGPMLSSMYITIQYVNSTYSCGIAIFFSNNQKSSLAVVLDKNTCKIIRKKNP